MSNILDDVFEGGKPTKIPVDSCIVSVDIKIDPDAVLISAIKKTEGIINPIVVERLENGKYGVLSGNRRVLSYRILKKEDSKYEEIRAYVAKGILTDEQKKAITFEERSRRKPMSPEDIVNVIEYFYMKFGRLLKPTAEALGITVAEVKKYLTHARLSDKVQEAMNGDDGFSIDVAMKALKALGDNENSVDDDKLIEFARELRRIKPGLRHEIVKEVKKGVTFEVAREKVCSTTTMKFEIELDEEIIDPLARIADEKGFDSVEEVMVYLLEKELFAVDKD